MSEREIEALDAEALARKEEALRRMNAALDAEMPDLAEVDAVIARAARDEAILAACGRLAALWCSANAARSAVATPCPCAKGMTEISST